MQNANQLQAEAPILKHTTDLYAEFYGYWKLFPKKDQYLLGKRCEEYILHFLELILLAVGSSREQKLKLLEQASRKFEVLKILFRMAKELKLLDAKKYISLEAKIQEIGKMLGGWMRSLTEKAR